MAIQTAPMLVAKPTPETPLRYGLFAAANGPFDLPEHARQGGLRYENPMCGPGFGYEPECGSLQNVKPAGTPIEIVTGTPFLVAAKILCGSVGYTEEQFQQFAFRRLKSIEQGMVEQILSSNTFGQAPNLVGNPAVVDVVTAATTVVDTVGVLENAMYSTGYGVPAVLHVGFEVGERMKSEHIIEWDGSLNGPPNVGKWRTALGTIVSIGDYANLSPAGAAPAAGTFWIYITGQVSIWRTPDAQVEIPPIEGFLNRTTNQVEALAEREYVVTFECGGFAEDVVLWT